VQLHAACCAVSIWGTVDKGMQSQLCLPLPTPMGDRKCYCFKACCKARVWYHDSECLALRVGGCQRSSGPQAARCVNVLHGWLACRNGDTRRRWRWRDESGGSVCIERAVGAVVAASREWGDGTCQHAHAVRARGSCALLRLTLVGSCG